MVGKYKSGFMRRKGKEKEEKKEREERKRKGSGGTLYRLCSRRNHNKIQNKNLFLSFRKTKNIVADPHNNMLSLLLSICCQLELNLFFSSFNRFIYHVDHPNREKRD